MLFCPGSGRRRRINRTPVFFRRKFQKLILRFLLIARPFTQKPLFKELHGDYESFEFPESTFSVVDGIKNKNPSFRALSSTQTQPFLKAEISSVSRREVYIPKVTVTKRLIVPESIKIGNTHLNLTSNFKSDALLAVRRMGYIFSGHLNTFPLHIIGVVDEHIDVFIAMQRVPRSRFQYHGLRFVVLDRLYFHNLPRCRRKRSCSRLDSLLLPFCRRAKVMGTSRTFLQLHFVSSSSPIL